MLRCKGQTLALGLFSLLFFSELCVPIQRDFGRLGRGIWESLVGITKAKGKVLHLGNPKVSRAWGNGSKPALREGIEDL